MYLISNINSFADQMIIANGFYRDPFSNAIFRKKRENGENIVNELIGDVCFLLNSKQNFVLFL